MDITVWSYLTFFVLGAMFGLMERLNPLRRTNWREGLFLDIVGLLIQWAGGAAFALAVIGLLGSASWHLEPSDSPILRGLLLFVIADFARYVAHFLMHTTLFWRTHRFHHSPTQLYWFSGNRATFGHIAFFAIPQTLLIWFMNLPPVLLLPLIIFGQIMNHLMHSNWNIDARWQRALEWVITTPRYHAIHHATDPKLAGKNLASIFTIWDRLFGTYVNPDHVQMETIEYGADVDAVPRYRMVLGV